MLRRNCHHFTPTTIYKTPIVLNDLVVANQKIQEDLGELNIKSSKLQQKTDQIDEQLRTVHSDIKQIYMRLQSDITHMHMMNIFLVCMTAFIR